MEKMLDYPHLYRRDTNCRKSATSYIQTEEVGGRRALLSSISFSKIVDCLIAESPNV